MREATCHLAICSIEDMLGDDLEAWLAESALMKRMFRSCAIIAGLIEKRYPGEEKSRRQLTISTDLVYDVLRKHQPDHLLLRAARADAATGLLDIKRLGEMLSRIQGRIVHKSLDHVSPLAVPVMLEIGRETVYGEAADSLLAEAADDLVKEAMQVRRLSSFRWSGSDSQPKAGRDGVRCHTLAARCACDLPSGPRRNAPSARITQLVLPSPLIADPAGALYWPERGLLVVSDLHLEKGSSFAMRGLLLPPYDSAATLPA